MHRVRQTLHESHGFRIGTFSALEVITSHVIDTEATVEYGSAPVLRILELTNEAQPAPSYCPFSVRALSRSPCGARN